MAITRSAGVGEVDVKLGASALLILSRVIAVDLVDLKIAKSSGQDWYAYVSSPRVSHHITDRVFTLGQPAILHVDQNGRPIGRVRLGEKTADNTRRIGRWRRSRRVARGRHDPRAFLDHGRDKGRAGS